MTQKEQQSGSPQEKPGERQQSQQQQQQDQGQQAHSGRSGSGSDSVLEQLRHWEQSRASDRTGHAHEHPG
jgi:hypothetical protein